MERVAFITIESDTDLIVSFAIKDHELGEVKSLTLIRTPKYERFLHPWERGVSVSHEDFPDEDFDLLKSIDLESGTVRITTQLREYALDVQDVDRNKIRRAAEILRRMNFDQGFVLKVGAL